MILSIGEKIAQLSQSTQILLTMSIALLVGYCFSKFAGLVKLPKITGYILAGIVIGPGCLKLIPTHIISEMSFISDIALAFISFGIGKFFKKEVIVKAAKKSFIITICECLLTGLVTSISLKFIFNLDWSFALLLGVIAMTTSSTSTMLTINQYNAKGKFVNTLLSVIAINNSFCLLAFSVATAGVSAGGQAIDFWNIFKPIVFNLASIILGFVFAVLLKYLVKNRSQASRLSIIIGILLLMAGLCSVVNVSPLLGCMVMGGTYINISQDKQLYYDLNSFTPPIMILFFVVSGMSLDFSVLGYAGLIGLAYFAIRFLTKYVGAYLGATISKCKPYIKNNIGLAILPQAGVSVGLAFLAQKMLPAEMGNILLAVIIAAGVLYEIAGPPMVKLALYKAESINRKDVSGVPIKYNYAPPEDYEFGSKHIEDIIQSISPEISTNIKVNQKIQNQKIINDLVNVQNCKQQKEGRVNICGGRHVQDDNCSLQGKKTTRKRKNK